MKQKLLMLLLFCCTFFVQQSSIAQTLVAGDIAFIGYNTGGEDGFSFITLKNMPEGEVLYFTEEGRMSGGWMVANEPHMAWTIPAGVTIGTKISVIESSVTPNTFVVTGTTPGSFVLNPTGTAYNFNLSGGDQILAYQSTTGMRPASPTFIAAIQGDYTSNNFDETTKWNDATKTTSNGNQSILPTGLTHGINCISLFALEYPSSTFIEHPYNKYHGTLTGTADAIRAAINNPSNWTGSATAFTIVPSDYPAASISANPTVTVSVTSLSAFAACPGVSSGEQSFTVSGTNLSANLVVTPPAGYEVALVSAGTYSNAISFFPNSGNVNTITVYARLKSDATGNPAGDITVVSGSASKNIAVTSTIYPGMTGSASGTNVSCNGGSNGTATAIANGGTGTKTYSWSPSNQTTQTATGLPFGVHTCTVTDANGCKLVVSTTLTQPTALNGSISKTDVTCNGLANGTATANPTGGAVGYSYSWSQSATFTPSQANPTAQTITGLTAGTYTCRITDANGCDVDRSVTIGQPATSLSGTITKTDVSCFNGGNGTATVVAVGGTTPYSYSWSPSGGTAATATGLTPGTYTCTITDFNSCDITESITVEQPATALSASITKTDVSCRNGGDGTATVVATGGTEGLGYTYSWAPSGGTAATATGLAAGTYTCTITDANSCETSESITIGQPGAVITAQIDKTDASCNGLANGTATVVATGGNGGYTYSWSPTGGTAATATGLAAGTYTCTIEDSKGCIGAESITVGQPAVLMAAASITDAVCYGTATGTARVIPQGGTAPYSYSWAHDGGTDALATGLLPGDYTCTITDANSCSINKVVTVENYVSAELTITPQSKTDVSCTGGANGSASISPATGGEAPYSYSWSPSGGTGTTATGLAAGTYTVTVTDALLCTKSEIFVIEEPATLVSATITDTVDVSCTMGANGSATVTATGGTAGYTYSWSPTGGSGATASGLSVGTYTVTVTDANGCTDVATAIVGEPAFLSATTTSEDVVCNGESNGTATVVATGGNGGYTYSWSPTGGSNATATGLMPGTYTVTVTDSKGCSTTANATINQPGAALSASTTKTDTSCKSGANGTATVVATGGNGGYTYSWSPSGDTGATAIGLTAGTYTVTVTDSKGCTTTATAEVEEPTAISGTIAKQDPLCSDAATGTATVTATGGVGFYTYSWSPTGGTAATATGLTAGDYTVKITDANGCEATVTTTIEAPAAIIATATSTNVSCNGGTNGTATVEATDGVGTYTYSWSPSGGTAATATGLAAGMYTVTVTDANGCTATATATVEEPALLTATATKEDVACNGETNGSATAVPVGGTSPYTYSWTNGGGTAVKATDLAPGTYVVTVTDANGCTATATAVIEEPSTALSATINKQDLLCNGDSNATATVTATGGVIGYTYYWSPSGGTAATAIGLAAGDYEVTVTDANGCTFVATTTIEEPEAIVATATSTSVSCNSGVNGTATVEATGGIGTLTYSWSPSGGTAATATGLSAGMYTVTVTDANGCTVTATTTVEEPALLTATTIKEDVACNGETNGSATAVPVGGTSPYTYSWTNGGGTAVKATDLAPGTYVVTVTDANGCTTTATAVIEQPAVALSATTTKVDIICNGSSTGSATVTAVGGTTPYTYSWSDDAGNDATVSNLAAGTYEVTVTDANGCTTTATAVIEQPSVAFIATATRENVTCNGESNGTATVEVTGGVGTLTYSWLPSGGTAATATGLAAGTYEVTVTDANGCTAIATTTVEEPNVLSATTTKEDVACNGETNGSATAVPVGGTSPYTYSWTNGGGTEVSASDLAPGTYEVTVTDANGCTATATAVIEQPAVALSATTTKVDVVCNGSFNGSATVTAVGGTSPYTYSWSDEAGTDATVSDLAAGTYEVTVTDAKGCTTTATAVIEQPSVAFVATAIRENVTCNGESNGSATVTVTGGVGTLTYSWTNDGGNAATASDLAAGTYEVTVTDENGCTAIASVVVEEPNVLSATTTKEDVACNGQTNGSATAVAVGGTSPYTYSWTNGGGTEVSASDLAPGTYEVTVTDANGCTATANAVIEQPAVALSATTTKEDVSCNGASTGSATVTVVGGTGDYTYSWSNGAGNAATATELAAGTYEVTVTDANGCTTTATAVIAQPATALSATTTKEDVSCNDGNNGSATVTATGGVTPYTYSWSNGGGSNATASGLTAGDYTVTITDANGCVTTEDVTIAEPLAIVITADPEDVTVVIDGTATFTVTATNADSYQWQVSSNGTDWSNITDGGTEPTYAGATTSTLSITNVSSALDSNEYRVLLTNGTDCVTESTSALLTVNNSIIAVNDDFSTVVINEGIGGTAGDVTANDLFNNVAVNDTDIIISVVDNDGLTGVTIDEAGNLTVPATATLGTYTITYSICENANPTNCSTAEAIVVVAPPLGIDTFKAFTVSVYPNPASTEVFIKIPEFSTHSNIKVTIYDMNGRTVKESNVTTEIQMIDISSLESGVYNFNIVSDNGTTTKRIVKNK